MMLLGDVERWCLEALRKKLDSIFSRYSHLDKYWILLITKNRYIGPPSAAKQTKDFILNSSNIVYNKFIITTDRNQLPPVRQFGTILWKVDNKKGQAKIVYALPVDAPVKQKIEYVGEDPFVGESAKGLPILN